MTRKQLKLGTLLTRRKVVTYWTVAVVVAAGTVALQWRISSRLEEKEKTEFFSNLPDIDLTGLQTDAREQLVREANLKSCPCNCGLTLACCRNRDRSCQTSLKICKEMVAKVEANGR